MPRNYRRRRSSGPKRMPVWFDNIVDQTLAGNGTLIFNLDNNIVQSVKKGLTIVRIIIDLLVMAQGTGTGGTLSAGICMVHGDARVGAAVPNPEDSLGEHDLRRPRTIRLQLTSETYHLHNKATPLLFFRLPTPNPAPEYHISRLASTQIKGPFFAGRKTP